MLAARIAAFLAAFSATVATGMPLGICRMDNTESHPSMELEDFTGTPITGSEVIDATIPGRCAAPPAPAMITFIPRCLASAAYLIIRRGVRCADTMVSSNVFLLLSGNLQRPSLPEGRCR